MWAKPAPSPCVVTELPPLRTFVVQRRAYNIDSATRSKLEVLTIQAHTIEVNGPHTVFVEYSLERGALVPHYKRILPEYFDIEELIPVADGA